MPILQQLASNPQVRRIAKQAGIAVARGTIKRIQRRRARRGKTIMFPGIMGLNAPKGGSVSRRVNQPVKVSVATRGANANRAVRDDELTALTIQPDFTSIGLMESMPLTPFYSTWGQKLNSIAQTYTRYSVRAARVTFTPSAGTQRDGTLWLGFTKDFAGAEQFQSAVDIESLPCHASCSVSQPCSFIIPVSEMNNNGKDLILDEDAAEAGSLSLYDAGVFFYGTSDCSAGMTTVGTFRFSYDIEFKQPQVPVKPASASLSVVDGEFALQRSGPFSVRVKSDGQSFVMSTARAHLILQRVPLGEHVGLRRDGNQLTPLWDLSDGTTWDLHVFRGVPIRGAVFTLGDMTKDVSLFVMQSDPSDALFDL